LRDEASSRLRASAASAPASRDARHDPVIANSGRGDPAPVAGSPERIDNGPMREPDRCFPERLMRHLGVLRGSGTLGCKDESIGRADYEFDGYLVRPGEIVASGEVHMDAALLADAFGRNGLTLRTDDGLVLSIRFSGKRLPPASTVAHADVREGLPEEQAWRRRDRPDE
jgi:hypothetical protein